MCEGDSRKISSMSSCKVGAETGRAAPSPGDLGKDRRFLPEAWEQELEGA